MSYCVGKYFRIAKRKNRMIVFNSVQGNCVALDEKSYKIFKFIEETNPEKEQIKMFSDKMEVEENAFTGLLEYLKKRGILYEN